jgi:hypothetical protein
MTKSGLVGGCSSLKTAVGLTFATQKSSKKLMQKGFSEDTSL